MQDPVARKVGWSTAFFYGLGAVASAAKTVPITSFLMLYYNQVVGLPALTVSAVLTISLLLDAVFDPLIGQISDNYASRFGRRLPFMYASAVPVTVLFIMLWMPPAGWSESALTLYFAACVIGVRFFDTFFELPHLALIPELTSQYHERTRLFTVRYLFEAVAGMLITMLAYNWFMAEKPDGTGGILSSEGYPAFAWFAGTIVLITVLSCTLGLHRRLAYPIVTERRPMSLRRHFSEMAETLKSRSFAVLALAAVFISIGSGIGSSLSVYWLIYYYKFTQAEISLLALPVLLGMMLTALTPAIGRRLGKRNAAILLLWIYGVAVSIPLLARLLGLIPENSLTLLVLTAAQAVFGAGAMTMVLITLSSMVSDLVEDAELRTGRRSEGLLLATSSFVRKATQGLGTLGAGIILSVVAFPRGAERNQVPDQLLADMAWLYLGVTVVLFLITTVVLLCIRQTRDMHEANLRRLGERQREHSTPAATELNSDSVGASAA